MLWLAAKNDAAIQTAVDESKFLSVRRLLFDVRARELGSLVTGMIGLRGTTQNVENELVRSRYARLAAISPIRLGRAFDTLAERMTDGMEGAMLLSGLTKKQITGLIAPPTNEYSFSHFEMLLREIIWKRDTLPLTSGVAVKREQLGLDYFLDWIIEQMGMVSTNAQQIRHVIGRAAASVLTTEPTMHDSPDFTAYYGFFLLAFSGESGSKVMEQLRLERDNGQGVTDAGIQRAGLLVGAFLGNKAIEKE